MTNGTDRRSAYEIEDVLAEAGTTKTEGGLEKMRTDSRIPADGR